MFLRKRKIAEPAVEYITNYSGSETIKDGLLFRVLDGKALLQEAYGVAGKEGLHSLLFDHVPLVRFHGEEYMCPTCMKLLSAGYGLDKADNSKIDSVRAALNEPSAMSLRLLESLSPLLGLLPSGVYALVSAELYPTDGDGHFFWGINNTPKLNAASCPFYENGNWLWEYPAFLLPSQPPAHCDTDRVSYYRSRPECRAIAYNMGFHNVLLDGHHKATAAALEGRTVSTLVILPASGFIYRSASLGQIESLRIGGETFPLDTLGLSPHDASSRPSALRLTEKETKKQLALREKSIDSYKWPQQLLDTSRYYPTTKALAYMKWAGDLSDERINRVINRQEFPDEEQMHYLCTALFYSKHPRFCELAFRVGKDERYIHNWYSLFQLLVTMRSESVEDFFVDYLVNDDGLRPEVTKVANDYLNNLAFTS